MTRTVHFDFRGRRRGSVIRAGQPTRAEPRSRWPGHVLADELGRRNAATCETCRALLRLTCCHGYACARIPAGSIQESRALLHFAVLAGDCPVSKLARREEVE